MGILKKGMDIAKSLGIDKEKLPEETKDCLILWQFAQLVILIALDFFVMLAP